ncbi:hypothetical protein Lal_00009816 [Lupinus albus]|uniref:Transcription repressor n=1 Tax=Lupinus albus TaxID=3870 RepID=A0A6A5LKS8_LUPAL|nr:putative transcription factor OFP family [Lupinus albus]KAF1859232.1 hypothetical protein Lal_00009816 [Lupinus albus]
MSSNKRSVMKTLLTPNGSCGCGKPKPSQVHEPIAKPKISIYQNTKPSRRTSSTTTTSGGGDHDEDFTSTTISETDTTHLDHKIHDKPIKDHQSISKPCPKLVGSIAVEKESDDPYSDFRYSMLQMIVEKEIYSENDLQELLQCFLQLNAPCHHHAIVQVFIEICEESFSKKLDGGGGETSCKNHIINGNR